MIQPTKERLEALEREFSTGFVTFCGIKAVEAGPGTMVSRVEITPDHRQQDGFVHAGVLATMSDHTAGYAAFTLVPENHRILTIEFKINYMRPSFGQALICRARVLKPGRKVLICEAEVFDVRDGQEVLTAKNLATMASVPISELDK